jgi:hypothetical protein
MAELAIKIEKVDEKKASTEIKERIFKTHTEELIIALCGPIGTEIHYVAECLNNILIDSYNYN